jgi:hypothetical protein
MSERKQAPVIPTFCVKRFAGAVAAVAARQRRFGVVLAFTGSKKSFLRVHRSIVGFSGKEIEAMLLRKWLPYAPFWRLAYVTPERVGLLASNEEGILGAYAGGYATANAYAAAHHLTTERRRVLNLLDNYRGELVIFGDVLRNVWQAREQQHALCAE